MKSTGAEAFSDGVFAIAITLLVINLLLLLLMGVVAIPFPTTLVAQNLHGAGGPAAAVTYGLVMIAISAGFAGLWVYVVINASKVGAALPPEALRRSIPGFTFGGAVYGAGTVIAASGHRWPR
jgi:uncharacterized membrane protein